MHRDWLPCSRASVRKNVPTARMVIYLIRKTPQSFEAIAGAALAADWNLRGTTMRKGKARRQRKRRTVKRKRVTRKTKPSTAIARVVPSRPPALPLALRSEHIDLLKRTVAKGTTDDEFAHAGARERQPISVHHPDARFLFALPAVCGLDLHIFARDTRGRLLSRGESGLSRIHK